MKYDLPDECSPEKDCLGCLALTHVSTDRGGRHLQSRVTCVTVCDVTDQSQCNDQSI